MIVTMVIPAFAIVRCNEISYEGSSALNFERPAEGYESSDEAIADIQKASIAYIMENIYDLRSQRAMISYMKNSEADTKIQTGSEMIYGTGELSRGTCQYFEDSVFSSVWFIGKGKIALTRFSPYHILKLTVAIAKDIDSRKKS